eukprot:scaffold24027_cov60-Phaeocystis_antarctica.AAC.9
MGRSPGGGCFLGQFGVASIASLKALSSQKAAMIRVTVGVGVRVGVTLGGCGSGGVGYMSEKCRLSRENSPMVHGLHGLPSSIVSNSVQGKAQTCEKVDRPTWGLLVEGCESSVAYGRCSGRPSTWSQSRAAARRRCCRPAPPGSCGTPGA